MQFGNLSTNATTDIVTPALYSWFSGLSWCSRSAVNKKKLRKEKKAASKWIGRSIDRSTKWKQSNSIYSIEDTRNRELTAKTQILTQMLLCLLGDGRRINPAQATDAGKLIELSEEPLTTTAATFSTTSNGSEVFQALEQSVKRLATGAINTCAGRQYDRFDGAAAAVGRESSVMTTAAAAAAAAATTTGFCGPISDEANLTGVELGFNTMDYNFSDIEPLWVRKQWPDILMRISFVAPVVLLGIIGNSTIIYSICKFKSFRSKPTNIFILSMAIADLITALVCPLAALFTDIYQFYVMGAILCRLEGSIKITCLLVSAYSLNWLSFIWLRYIVQPCKTRISIKQSWIILAGIWMASVLMATPLFCWRMLRSRQWRDLNELWCCELIHISKYYWVVITFIIVYLPTFFMTIFLVIILIQMDKFEAKLRRSRTNQSNSSLTINMKYRRRIVKVLILYLGISIVCWAPFQFSIIYRHFRKEACLPPGYSDFVFASQLLASVPGALNPFVFGFLSQPFRKVVSNFWMFEYLNKLLIWRSRPNSENHQMEIQGTRMKDHRQKLHQQRQQHPMPAANYPTTTRLRSGSTSHGRRPMTTTANATQRVAPAQHRQHHHQHQQQNHHRSSRHHSSKQNLPSIELMQQNHNNGDNSKRTTHRVHSNGTRNQHHYQPQSGSLRAIRGRENAAYESTVGDEKPMPRLALDAVGEKHRDIGTTSFIRDHHHQHRQHHQHHHHDHHHHHNQSKQPLERPLSPTSVVSMDSINIEENLGTNTMDEPNNNIDHHLYQQQQPDDKVP